MVDLSGPGYVKPQSTDRTRLNARQLARYTLVVEAINNGYLTVRRPNAIETSIPLGEGQGWDVRSHLSIHEAIDYLEARGGG